MRPRRLVPRAARILPRKAWAPCPPWLSIRVGPEGGLGGGAEATKGKDNPEPPALTWEQSRGR